MKKCFLLLVFLISEVFGKVEKKFNLEDLENYFDNIKQIESEFTEKNIKKKYHGKFFLNKTRKNMEMTYTDRPLKITVKNYEAEMYDSKLEEHTKIPVHSSPLAFLLKNKINLKKEVKVIDLSENNNILEIKLCKKNSDENGAITLKFSKNPFKLIGWKIFEDKNYNFEDKITEFSLINPSIQMKKL